MIKLKLKKIEDAREGFVYELGDMQFVIVNESDCFHETFENYTHIGNGCSGIETKGKLIGKIGLTHKIENGKLIELPRKEIEVGDIIHSKTITYVEYDEDPVSFQEYLKEVHFLYDGSIVPYDQREEIDDLYEELSEFGRLGIQDIHYELITEYEEE
jgi:hypothetical protein